MDLRNKVDDVIDRFESIISDKNRQQQEVQICYNKTCFDTKRFDRGVKEIVTCEPLEESFILSNCK